MERKKKKENPTIETEVDPNQVKSLVELWHWSLLFAGLIYAYDAVNPGASLICYIGMFMNPELGSCG